MMIMENYTDNDWLNIAIEEALKAEALDEVPVGAVLISDDGQMIAKAHNQPITTDNPTAHAEIEVLRKAGQQVGNYRLPNTTLYVTLEPCPMCAGAIIHARVGRVVFAAKDLRTGACGTVFNLHHRQELNHRFQADFVERPDYIDLLKSFFKKRRTK